LSRSYRHGIAPVRWASREMRLSRWHVGPGELFRSGDPLCDVVVDGELQTIRYSDDDIGIFFWSFVDEGEEVPPSGALFEYSTTDGIHPHLLPAPEFKPGPGPKLIRRSHYPRIFLNYRRDDSEAYAGRIHETLIREFGPDDVFMDQFSVRPGEPFLWVVQQAVAHCDILVSIIGPRWRTATDRYGNIRLEAQSDTVRLEINAALDRRTPVVPILVDGTSASLFADLPDELYRLGDHQALTLSTVYWQPGMQSLLDSIGTVLGRAQ
jgi:hypothetical protein